MKTNIALDGPLNGQYITPEQASANDYELIEWTESEFAYLHTTSAVEHDDDPALYDIEQESELEAYLRKVAA